MNKEFCTYEQALALKELGFDEPSFKAYNSKCVLQKCTSDYWDNSSLNIINEATTSDLKVLAPLYQQAFRWFREKYKLAADIRSEHLGYYTSIVNRDVMLRITMKPVNIFETYEEAEQVCLNKLIEIVKTNEKI